MPLRPGSHDHAQGACRGTESQISDDRSGRDHDARKVRTIRELDPDFAVRIFAFRFGDLEYWSARRSMRFAQRLTDVADKFRADNLDSNDKKDNTVKTIKWENFHVSIIMVLY